MQTKRHTLAFLAACLYILSAQFTPLAYGASAADTVDKPASHMAAKPTESLKTSAHAVENDHDNNDDKEKTKKEPENDQQSVSKQAGDALGISEEEFPRATLNEEVPQRIAILPATGDGADNIRQDIRTSIYNHVSSLTYHSIKPFIVDARIKKLKQQGMSFKDIDSDQLAKVLDVQGLLYVDVDNVERFYVAAYAHYKIKVTASLYSVKENKIIWKDSKEVIERSGGIPLDPLSLLATAFSSSLVLGDSIRIMLTDKLGRQFAQSIPIPVASGDGIQPPKLTLATSNAIEGPFRAGAEVRVGAQADSGLIATFSLGKLHQDMPLQEQEPGKYIGSWVVPEKETNQHIIPTITLINPESRSKLEWDIPGVVEIDTTAPTSLSQLQATPLQGAIKLTWKSNDLPASIASFVVQRSDEKGVFQTISQPSLATFSDKNIVLGQHYHYQVYAIDQAGNKSSISAVDMMAIKPGPNALSGDLNENYTLSAYGSPYIIDGVLNILSAAKLLVGEGVIIQMHANSQINVLGGMVISGTEDNPVQIEGSNMHINFQGGQSSLNHLIVQSMRSTMKISANVKMMHTSIIETRQAKPDTTPDSEQSTNKNMPPPESPGIENTGKNTGIIIEGRAQVLLDDVLLQGQHTAIAMNGGQAQFNGVRFLMHNTALKVAGDSHISYDDLTFDKNTIHVESTVPLVFQRHYFIDKGFENLISKVRGEASIDWADSTRVSNDLDHWLMNKLKEITRTLAQKGMKEAAAQAQAMQAIIKNSKTTHIAEILQTIHTGTLPKAHAQRSVAALKMFFNKHFRQDKNIHYWIQEQKIITNAAFSNSEEYLYHKADEKINTAYLRNRFPNTSPIKLRRSSRAINCKEYTPLSIILTKVKTKKHMKVWILRGTYDKKINQYLVNTGLIKRPVSYIHIALLGEVNSRSNWLAVMRNQNMQSKDIGTGEMSKQMFIDAKKLHFDFVLHFSIKTNKRSSSISSNLYRINGVLDVAVYDVNNKLKIESFSQKGRATGFNQAEAEKKIVTKTLHKIQPDLMAFLVKQDNLAKQKHAAGQ